MIGAITMSFPNAIFRAGVSVRGMFLLALLSFAGLALAAETAGAESIDIFQLTGTNPLKLPFTTGKGRPELGGHKKLCMQHLKTSLI